MNNLKRVAFFTVPLGITFPVWLACDVVSGSAPEICDWEGKGFWGCVAGTYLPFICGGYLFTWIYPRLLLRYGILRTLLVGLITWLLLDETGIRPYHSWQVIVWEMLPGGLYVLLLGAFLVSAHGWRRADPAMVEGNDGRMWLRLAPLLVGLWVFVLENYYTLFRFWICDLELPLVGFAFSFFPGWVDFLIEQGLFVVVGYAVMGVCRQLIRRGHGKWVMVPMILQGILVAWWSVWFLDLTFSTVLRGLGCGMLYMVPFFLILRKYMFGVKKDTEMQADG